MNTALITENDLKEWTGFERRADIERVLRSHGIPVMFGRGGMICTTIGAVETALGAREPSNSSMSEDIE